MYGILVAFDPTRATPVAMGTTKACISGMWLPNPKAQGTEIVEVAAQQG